jgi:hypothetical protein
VCCDDVAVSTCWYSRRCRRCCPQTCRRPQICRQQSCRRSSRIIGKCSSRCNNRCRTIGIFFILFSYSCDCLHFPESQGYIKIIFFLLNNNPSGFGARPSNTQLYCNSTQTIDRVCFNFGLFNHITFSRMCIIFSIDSGHRI